MIIKDSTGALIALAGIGPQTALAEVTMQSSITYDGVTLTFSEAVPTCELAGGRPAILTHLGDVVITNDTPTAEDVGGYFANGAMWNPYLEFNEGGTQPQGFDESPENPANPRANKSVFSVAVCVSPSYSGNGNLTVSQGETGTFVKSVRRSGEDGDWYASIEKYVPFTFLDAVPIANAVRPSMSGLDKSCTVTPADFDYSVFQSVALPASMKTLEYLETRVPVTFPHFGWMGDTLRAFTTINDAYLSDDGYAGEYAAGFAEYWCHLHSDISSAAKADTALRLAEWARDLKGVYDRGWRGGYGAGQHHGVHEPMFLGAFLLQDSAMLAAAQDTMSNMYAAQWLTEDDENNVVGFPSLKGNPGNAPYARPVFAEDVGKPMYVGDGEGATLNRRYLSTAGPSMFAGMMPLLGLKNGPAGETGAVAIAQSDDLTSANPLAAPTAYADRMRTWQPWNYVGNTAEWARDFYDAVRNASLPARFTYTPDAYEGDKFSAGAGAISWDLSAIDYSGGLTITNTLIRYGIDEVSFVELTGQALTDSVTGLNKGVPHYCQYAQENSKGRGIWSHNFPAEYTVATETPGPLRDVVTPTGTDSNAAPSWTGRLAPALFYQPAEEWEGPYYLPVDTGSNLPETVTKLTAGVGYPSGYPAPTPDDFTYQWEKNGTPIGGETGKTYQLVPGDLGQDIRCEVTVTTTEGTASIYTDAVTVYPIPTLAAGVHIDTDCGASMALVYPDIMATALSFASDVGPASPLDEITHLPVETLKDQVPSMNTGVIWCKKLGGRQTFSFQVGPVSGTTIGDVVSGTEYRVTIDVLRSCNVSRRPDTNDPTWLAPVEFCVGSAQARNSQNFVANQNIATDSGTPGKVTVTGTFTPGSTGPAYVNFTTTHSTGGVGGDPVIDSILFEEV